MQKNCEYFNGIQKDQVINPNTVGREECQKEGSNWYFTQVSHIWTCLML